MLTTVSDLIISQYVVHLNAVTLVCYRFPNPSYSAYFAAISAAAFPFNLYVQNVPEERNLIFFIDFSLAAHLSNLTMQLFFFLFTFACEDRISYKPDFLHLIWYITSIHLKYISHTLNLRQAPKS